MTSEDRSRKELQPFFLVIFVLFLVTYAFGTPSYCEKLTESMNILKWLLHTKFGMFVTQHSNWNREDVNINGSKSADLE